MRQIVKNVIIIMILVGLVGFIIIQFIPYGRFQTNPPVVSEPNWGDQQTRELAKRACFDCHSNETIWPWYSKFAPVSWLVYRDVEEGRHIMNFSDWQYLYITDANEIVSVLNEGEMPPFLYLLMHSSARLSSSEKAQFIDGLVSTFSR